MLADRIWVRGRGEGETTKTQHSLPHHVYGEQEVICSHFGGRRWWMGQVHSVTYCVHVTVGRVTLLQAVGPEFKSIHKQKDICFVLIVRRPKKYSSRQYYLLLDFHRGIFLFSFHNGTKCNFPNFEQNCPQTVIFCRRGETVYERCQRKMRC